MKRRLRLANQVHLYHQRSAFPNQSYNMPTLPMMLPEVHDDWLTAFDDVHSSSSAIGVGLPKVPPKCGNSVVN